MALPSLYGRKKNSFTEKYMSILSVDGQPEASFFCWCATFLFMFVCSLLYFFFISSFTYFSLLLIFLTPHLSSLLSNILSSTLFYIKPSIRFISA